MGNEAIKLGGDQSVHGHLECLVFKNESVHHMKILVYRF